MNPPGSTSIDRIALSYLHLSEKSQLDKELSALVGLDSVLALKVLGLEDSRENRRALRIVSSFVPARLLGSTVGNLKGLAQSSGVRVGDLRRIYEGQQQASEPVILRKKRGRKRTVYRPTDVFRPAIDWIYSEVVSPLDRLNHNFAHAYRTSVTRNTVSCMKPHQNSDWFIKLDIADFFNTVDDRMVRGAFLAGGHEFNSAAMLANLTTLPSGGESQERFLPQGYPTSGVLANLALRKFDSAIASWVRSENERVNGISIRFTRYSDDIIISGLFPEYEIEKVGSPSAIHRTYVTRIVSVVRELLKTNGFRLNQDKSLVVQQPQTFRALGIEVKGGKLSPPKRIRIFLEIQAYGIGKKGVSEQSEAWAKRHCSCALHSDPLSTDLCIKPRYRALISGYLTYCSSIDAQFVRDLRQTMGPHFPEINGHTLDTGLIRFRDHRDDPPSHIGKFHLNVPVDVEAFGQIIPKRIL